MNTEEFKIKRSNLVGKLVYYETMIEKFMKLKQITSDRLARNEDLLTESESEGEEYMEETESESEGEEYMDESETDGEGEGEEMIIDRSQPFVVTPINKNVRSKSQVDYNEQMARQLLGEQLMWDDTRYNSTKRAGGMFAFVHNDMKVELCQITGVYSPEHRLASWSENVGQGDRNVLELTKVLVTLTWDEWIKHGGHAKVQGTTNVKKNKDALLNFIESRM